MTLRLYLRRSKGDALQHYSLDVQREGARDYFTQRLASELGLAARAWESRVEFVDDDRAGDDFAGREGLQRLLKDTQSGDVIVCRSQDRLGRDALEVTLAIRSLVRDRGGRLFFYDSRQEVSATTAMDQVTTFIRGTGHQIELEGIRSRTKEALRNRVRMGRLAGGACYGYKNVQHPDADGRRKNTTAVIDETQAEIVRRIFSEARAGSGFKKIAVGLNADGHRNAKGAPWSDAAVRVILTNRRYTGVYIHGRVDRVRSGDRRIARAAKTEDLIVVEMPEWMIVDEITFASVQAMFKQRERGARTIGPAAKYALTGTARCAECDGAVGVDGRTIISRDGERVRVPAYVCLRHRRDGACSTSLMQSADEVEGALVDFVQTHVLSPKVIDDLIAGIGEEVREQTAQPASDLTALERNLAKLVAEQRHLARAVAQGDGIDALLDELRSRQREIVELKVRLETARRAPAQIEDLIAKVETAVRKKLGDLRTSLSKDAAGAREAYGELFPNGLKFRPVTLPAAPGRPRARRVWAISGTAHLGECGLVVTPPGLEPGHPT
jgi:DNA invertase Pin-like site-specific DNA recombinase